MRISRVWSVLGAAAVVATSPAIADEVAGGTILNAANYSALTQQKFEGKSIRDMITPGQEMLIKDYGLQMRLMHAMPEKIPPKLLDVTKANNNTETVSLGQDGRQLVGYISGIPFPEHRDDDPNLAWKLMWNIFYASTVFGNTTIAAAKSIPIDSVRGPERESGILAYFVNMKHRYVGPESLGTDPSVFQRSLVFNTEPYDIAGTGAYILRYDDGRPDDAWAYVKSVRRIRRVSGNTWMDPIPASDMLNDDAGCLKGYPLWYSDAKVVNKRWILSIRNLTAPDHGTFESVVDTTTPPHWNPRPDVVRWEPREVYTLEVTNPNHHPYKRKIVYYDPGLLSGMTCEMYDRKDELWKYGELPIARSVAGFGEEVPSARYNWWVDMQRAHSTVFFTAVYYTDIERFEIVSENSLKKSNDYTAAALAAKYGVSGFQLGYDKFGNEQ